MSDRASQSEKRVAVDMPLSLWSWCREEAGKVGMRGVKPYMLDLAVRERQRGGIGNIVSGEDGGLGAAEMTNRELTDKKQALIDDWVLAQLEDVETLNALPKQTKAGIILARLPKMGVSKGEMEEKALSLRAALKGIADVPDIQSEMVTLREECRRLRAECTALEGELNLVNSELSGSPAGSKEDFIHGMIDVSIAWRTMIKDALTGRAAASRCNMLRKKYLLDIWEKTAMGVAKVALDVSLVTQRINESKPDEEED